MIKNKNTLILISILAVAIVVLVVLFSAVINKVFIPAFSGGEQWIELPLSENMPILEAKAKLDALGIAYEVKPTDSRIANRVEKFEYVGKTEDGKSFIEANEIVTLYSNEKSINEVIYLTFDDGPTYSNTFDILDTLDTYGAKATFFVLGNRIEEYANRIIATCERGHLVACHSYSHTIDRASKNYVYASVNAMLNEIDAYESALKNVLGEEVFSAMPKAFRFPGGSSTNGRISKSEALEYIASIREKGYKIYDWTSLTGDAEGKSTANEFISYMSSGIEKAKTNGDPLILLMHDKLTTNEALHLILERLISDGYYFDTIDNCPEYTFAEQ